MTLRPQRKPAARMPAVAKSGPLVSERVPHRTMGHSAGTRISGPRLLPVLLPASLPFGNFLTETRFKSLIYLVGAPGIEPGTT